MITREDLKKYVDARIVSSSEHGYSIELSDDYDYVVGELQRLADALDEWRKENDKDNGGWSQAANSGPFYNTGYCFANDVFIAASYDWSDDPVNVNFLVPERGIDITWYKWFGRGTYCYGEKTINTIKNRKLGVVIDECVNSLAHTRNDFTGATN